MEISLFAYMLFMLIQSCGSVGPLIELLFYKQACIKDGYFNWRISILSETKRFSPYYLLLSNHTLQLTLEEVNYNYFVKSQPKLAARWACINFHDLDFSCYLLPCSSSLPNNYEFNSDIHSLPFSTTYNVTSATGSSKENSLEQPWQNNKCDTNLFSIKECKNYTYTIINANSNTSSVPVQGKKSPPCF